MNRAATYSVNPEIQQILIQTMNGSMGVYPDKRSEIGNPVIGRILSPDKYVQSHVYTQSYNRYSYCFNNPLKYTDPSGWTAFKTWSEFWNEVNYLWDNGGGNWNSTSGRNSVGNEGGIMQASVNAISGSNGWGYTNFPNGATVEKHDPKKVNTGMTWYVRTADATKWPNKNDAVWYSFEAKSVPYAINSANTRSNKEEPISPIFSWINNGINTLSYGVIEAGGTFRFMKSGVISLGYYSSGWSTGNQYVKTTYNVAKLWKGIGYGTSAVGVVIGGYNFYVSDKSWGDYGQLGISLLSSGLTLGVVTTPFGIGIGVIDLFHGFDGFYNYLDTNQQLYKRTGLIMIPNNLGVPMFIKLK